MGALEAWLAAGLAFLGGLAWCLWRAPAVHPDHCPIFEDIRQGLTECGGPCTTEQPLPCAEIRSWWVRSRE